MSGTCGSTKRIGQMMWGAARKQDLALDQRLADQPELVILEIAQAAMDQLAAAGRCALREIVLLAQEHLEAAPGGIAGDPGAVDAATHHQEVVKLHRRRRAQFFFFFFRRGSSWFSLAAAALGRGP